jgi:biopolymer transport protein ExbD
VITSSLRVVSDASVIDSPDLLPLLDILFMLIVFFLLTANSVQQVLELDLPTEGSDQATSIMDEQPIMLHLFSGNERWNIGDQTFDRWIDVEQFLQNAYQQDNNQRVIIVGDRNAPMERMLQVLAFLKRENRTAAQILMKPKTDRVTNNE